MKTLLNSPMGIRWIKPVCFLSFLILGNFCFWGCSFVRTIEYPKPILLNSNPVVSVRYEYENVQLNLSKQVLDGEPTAYRFSIFNNSDINSPLISKIFFPDDTITVMLPLNVLSIEDSANVAILIPQGDDFEIVENYFSIEQSGVIEFPTAYIRRKPVILVGNVSRRIGDTPIEGAKVQIIDSIGVVGSSETNNFGQFTIELPSPFKDRKDLNLTVSTAGKFSRWRNQIDFQGEKWLSQPVVIGPRALFVKQGMVYRVIQNNTPFREGPENGSPIRFFLSEGDIFVAEKVAGDQLFGRVEIPIDKNDYFQHFEGWIKNKYLNFIQ